MTDTPWTEEAREEFKAELRSLFVGWPPDEAMNNWTDALLTALTPYVRAVVEQAVEVTEVAYGTHIQNAQKQARAEALEQAAKLTDDYMTATRYTGEPIRHPLAVEIGKRIRALAAPKEEPK